MTTSTSDTARFPRSTLFLASLWAMPALAWSQASTYREPPAQSIRIAPPQAAHVASGAASAGAVAPLAVLGAALRERGASDATVRSLAENGAVAGPVGAVAAPVRPHVRFQQQVDGLVVHGSDIKGAFDASGALVQVVQRLVALTDAPGRPAQVDERQALAAALARLHPGVDGAALAEGTRTATARRYIGGQRFHDDPEVTRVWIPQEDGSLQQGYRVQTWTARDNQLDHTLVGGDGTVLAVISRTAHDRYNVYQLDPAAGPQTVVDGPGAGNAESPGGWLGGGTQRSIDITGNNVRAYLDAVSDNIPDSGGTTVADGAFVAKSALTQAPGTTANRAVAVQNLFFLNNTLHDVLRRHGFDEAAGNFQVDNFGLGGKGADPVLAEAQDGGGTNNANFATPPDGASPRMQMYLWDGASAGALQRDGDLDADVVAHEYGHGLTWRMVGGMSGPLAGAIGEGASDALAFLLNGRDAIGTYSYGKPGGIRRHRYAGYPLTYADVAGLSVHADGEIYAAAVWRLRELWLKNGRTDDSLLDVFVDGLNHTPSTPAYEDMRDGMLDAVAHDGSDAAARCTLVWEAFAQFGIGDGAKGVVSGNKVTVTPSTRTRQDCSH